MNKDTKQTKVALNKVDIISEGSPLIKGHLKFSPLRRPQYSHGHPEMLLRGICFLSQVENFNSRSLTKAFGMTVWVRRINLKTQDG
jgi:hypothetical protein